MPVAWYVAPYKTRNNARGTYRYCAMDDFTAQIRADGGDWSETEVLGNQALVKVRATGATLTAINAAADFTRIPLDRLNDPLSSLTVGQRNAIRQKLLDAGYSDAEIVAAVPVLANVTLRQVLKFFATRRLKPRMVNATTIAVDGAVQSCKDPDIVDAAVNDT